MNDNVFHRFKLLGILVSIVLLQMRLKLPVPTGEDESTLSVVRFFMGSLAYSSVLVGFVSILMSFLNQWKNGAIYAEMFYIPSVCCVLGLIFDAFNYIFEVADAVGYYNMSTISPQNTTIMVLQIVPVSIALVSCIGFYVTYACLGRKKKKITSTPNFEMNSFPDFLDTTSSPNNRRNKQFDHISRIRSKN